MMTNYRFSPIKDKEQLMEAITYIHFACFELCKKFFGVYLPASGNIGIFCHYDDEYEFLTKLREELTDKHDNWNQKYFRLNKPITISKKDDIPETTYTYIYVRRPDENKPEVGDVDLVLEKEKFSELKNTSISEDKINNVDILYRPDLDMLRLSNTDVDVLSYITTTFMDQKGF